MACKYLPKLTEIVGNSDEKSLIKVTANKTERKSKKTGKNELEVHSALNKQLNCFIKHCPALIQLSSSFIEL